MGAAQGGGAKGGARAGQDARVSVRGRQGRRGRQDDRRRQRSQEAQRAPHASVLGRLLPLQKGSDVDEDDDNDVTEMGHQRGGTFTL